MNWPRRCHGGNTGQMMRKSGFIAIADAERVGQEMLRRMEQRRTAPPSDLMTIETFGLVLAGGLARRMGGGDKALITIGGETILAARARAADAASAAASCSTPTAIRRALPHSGCRWSPTACRISPDRSPAFSPGSTGWRRTAGHRMDRERAGRLPVSAARSGGAAACGAHHRRQAARLRPIGRLASSGRRPLAGRAARGFAPRAHGRRTCARSRCGPRATASRSPTGRPSRSIRSST